MSPTTTWDYIKYQTPLAESIHYSYDNTTLTITGDRDDSTYEIIMAPCGPNNIFAIQTLTLSHEKENITIISGTDWIGPYVVRDISVSSDTPWYFTGGWHETLSQEEPTAKMIDLLITNGNNKPISPASRTSKVIVQVTNLINDYNTNSQALIERITYTIDHNEVAVSAEIEAIKACEIETYFGLQIYHGPMKNSISYHSETMDYKYTTDISSYGPLKEEGAVYAMTLMSNYHSIKGWIDPETDLGDLRFLADNQSSAFTMSYGKSYFNLINGIPCRLNPGDTLTWSGGYQLNPR